MFWNEENKKIFCKELKEQIIILFQYQSLLIVGEQSLRTNEKLYRSWALCMKLYSAVVLISYLNNSVEEQMFL